MQRLKFYSFIFILPVMLLSYTDYLRTGPVQLQGTVTDAVSGKPIEKAYLYVLQGNEEILTDEKGNFTLKTWQELPFSLTIEHKDYSTSVLKITEVSRTLKIKISRK